jgi:hypothetical protein
MNNSKKIILFCLFIATFFSCSSIKTNKEVNVLFIGNSYTYFYKMPNTLQFMLNETNPNIKISQITFPGMQLNDHLEDVVTETEDENSISTRPKNEGELTETEKKILEKKWDYIILQTGTVTILIPENVDAKINKAIVSIKSLNTNPNCKFILFETWASLQKYPKKYCYSSEHIYKVSDGKKYCSAEIKNLEEEVKLIQNSYTKIAKENSLIKTNNCYKFYTVLKNYPSISLYDDEDHPNGNGSFLNACVFYKLITNKNLNDLKFHGEIDKMTAQTIKKVVQEK